MSVPVDIFVKDDSVAHNPIAGVTVGVFDPSTFAVIAFATTDVNGDASFLLPGAAGPGGQVYQVRLYKLGVVFKNPFSIAVIEPLTPPPTNKFDVQGTLLTLDVATDPRLCRCTGRFVDFSNNPVSGAVVRIMARADTGSQVPKMVDGNMVSPQVLALTTDEDGMVVVDLLRTGVYYITFSGDDDTEWNILIPDRSSVNLNDLMHPMPVSVTYDPTVAPSNAITIHLNQPTPVPFTVLFTDYEVLGTDADFAISDFIEFTIGDGTVVEAGFTNGSLDLLGLAIGTTTITPSAVPNLLPAVVPSPNVTGAVLTVTVIP